MTHQFTVLEQVALISIHTSPKGYDTTQEVYLHVIKISIHTSPKGDDFSEPTAVSTMPYFNPHLPEGR